MATRWEASDISNSQNEPERLVKVESLVEEEEFDAALRPKKLEDYKGQSRVKDNLALLIRAAKQRSESLDHILLAGPPGLGKTTLAAVIANEMGVNIRTTSGPAITRSGDLAALLTNLQDGDVLFIDEIHRLSRTVEEMLYPAMEDQKLDIMIGQGPAARSVVLELPRFTLIGATTRTGLLSAPLRDRFGIVFRLDYYEPEELETIIYRSAQLLKIEVDPGGAGEVGRRSRGTPRLANRLLKRVRDYAQVHKHQIISRDIADEALEFFQVDQLGLDRMDLEILRTLALNFEGRPVGLSTLSGATGEDAGTLEDVYEPFLLRQGLIIKTPKGRQATPRAIEHLSTSEKN